MGVANFTCRWASPPDNGGNPNLPPHGRMHHAVDAPHAATPWPAELAHRLGEHMAALVTLVQQYRAQPLTPVTTFAFEKKLRICCVRPGVR